MIPKISVPRGTSDILPDAAVLWEGVESAARRILKSYGYRELRTPIYEETGLFQRSLGQTSDVVNKQLLKLQANAETPTNPAQGVLQVSGLLPSVSYALRPEGTAAIVRSYLEHSFDKQEPLSKLFYIGPMFRGERPQKGRLRQFHQIGAEVIGPNSASPLLDAETIALAVHVLKGSGVQHLKVKINSLGDPQDKTDFAAYLRDQLRDKQDKLCEDCQRRYEKNTLRILDCKNKDCQKIVHHLKEYALRTPMSKEYFQSVQNALKDLEIPFEVDAHLVRGLDYYTHTVFEITASGELGSQDAVGAGGRYDGLMHQLGGDEKINFCAIGFALGIERILLASGAQGAPSKIDTFVIAMDAAYQKQAFTLVDHLRKAGISADMSYAGGRIGPQMNRANKLNARFALILGEEEMKNKSCAVKDMTSGTQENVAVQDLLKYLKNKID